MRAELHRYRVDIDMNNRDVISETIIARSPGEAADIMSEYHENLIRAGTRGESQAPIHHPHKLTVWITS